MRVAVPPSKSQHQRYLILQALADTPVPIHSSGDAEPSQDVVALWRAMQCLGTWADGALGASRESRTLNLGYCGAGFRFSMVAAALRPAGSRTLVTGRPALLARPHRPLLRSLIRLGVAGKRRGSGAMRVLSRVVPPDSRVWADATTSSQFVSALALAAPRWGGLRIDMVKDPVSLPYIETTRDALRSAGIGSAWVLETDRRSLLIDGGAPAATSFVVEPDASSAAVWWALAAMRGGRTQVQGLTSTSLQADMNLLDVLDLRSAVEPNANDGFVLNVSTPLRDRTLPKTFDLQASSDLVPIVAAAATQLPGHTRIVGASHVQWKESRRLHTMAEGICALGGEADVTNGVLTVGDAPLSGGVVDCHGDHRLVMAFALLGAGRGDVVVRGAQAVAKSYPEFPNHFLHIAQAS